MSDSPDKDLPDEQQLDEYLRGGSAVSRQYRQLHSADVPAEIDRLVLRQAQEAVKARPAKSRAWVRWAAPLAVAASAVLVVSIVIESGVHEETVLVAPASAPAEVTIRQEAAEPPAGSAAKKRALEAEESQDNAVAGDASDANVVRVAPVPVEPTASPQFAPPPAAPVPQATAPSEDRAFAIRPTTPVPQLESAQPSMKVEAPELDRRKQVDAAPTVTTPAPAPVAAPNRTRVRELDTSLEEAIVTATKRREQSRTAGPRNSVAMPAAAVDAAEQGEEPRDYSDPEQWLRDIRELRKENKHDAADREWRRFRSVFPNYAVAEADPARGALR